MNKEIKLVAGIVASMAVIVMLITSVYVVKEGSVGVRSTLGKFNNVAEVPGLYMKVPIIDAVTVLDTKVIAINYKGAGARSGEAGIINRPLMTTMDSKNLSVKLDMTVQFRVVAAETPSILRSYGVNYIDKTLNNIIRSVVRDVAGAYRAETIASERGKLADEISVRLGEQFAAINFTLVKVSLRNIVLPPAVLRKVIAVQEAKQREAELKMQEQQALVTSRIQLIDAKRDAAKVLIAANAEADKVVIAKTAQARGISTISRAVAAANNRVAVSLTPLLVRQHTVEKWTGEYPHVVSDAGMLLNIK